MQEKGQKTPVRRKSAGVNIKVSKSFHKKLKEYTKKHRLVMGGFVEDKMLAVMEEK